MRKFLIVGILGLIGSQVQAQYVVNSNCPSCQSYRPVGKVEQAAYNTVNYVGNVSHAVVQPVREAVKKRPFRDAIKRVFGRNCK